MMYIFYRVMAFLVRRLPRKGAYWIGLRICDLMYYLNPHGRRSVRNHMRIIFEHQDIVPSRRVLDGYTRKTFQAFGKYLADFIRYKHLTPEGVRETVSIQGLKYLEAIRDSDHGAILLTAHYGNWEMGGAIIAAMDIPINAVVRPVESPSLERIFSMFRRQRGLKVIPLAHAGVGILKALKRGEVVALVGDRDFTGNGQPAHFFGREVSLPRGAAWFSHRTGIPVTMGFVTRAPDDTFILRIHPPIDPVAAGSEGAIQAHIIRIMEETIARDPSQWFIFDPFWPDEAETDESPKRGSPEGFAPPKT
ncbi:MAG: lysophospholipid acyltransferase family protein [Kiritimatiellia bacterium]|jgi:KDO2-lipid IV(A) lauroyltransferase|nr:lysophospholipid acyltransferase family protein [Kiritimatiellia bacterium]